MALAPQTASSLRLAHVGCKEDILMGIEVAPTTPIEDHFRQHLSVKLFDIYITVQVKYYFAIAVKLSWV